MFDFFVSCLPIGYQIVICVIGVGYRVRTFVQVAT